ncbi:MAG: FeoA domain-containing protein [Elusimicrobia bacterium]|nr:FeoA domain-containing protein [Elusimicrobiota bacterium]
MTINEHKSKENIDIEEALGVIWTSIQRGEDNFETVSEKVKQGVDEKIVDELLNGKYIVKEGSKIKLTDTGEDLGKQLTRRHRLTERLLADVLDFDRQAIEKIACDLEHNLSTDLADSICTLLGHPKQCPHGNPIPEGNCCKNSSSKIESIVVPLSKIDIAEEVTLSYIVTTNHDYMHKLLSLGMVPGTKLKLHQKFPTYIVKVNETQIALDGEVANLIYVRK